MNTFISPILGEIKEDVFNFFSAYKTTGYESLVNVMKRNYNWGRLKTGILFTETEFNKPVQKTGSEIQLYLFESGVPTKDSKDIIKTLCSNNLLTEQLTEKGFNKDAILYGTNPKDRLKQINLKDITCELSYAKETPLEINPVIVFKEEIEKEISEEIKEEALIEEEIPRKENELVIEIIPEELPFTIDSDENYEQFIQLIEQLNEYDINIIIDDIERNLKFVSFVELYYPEENLTMLTNEPTTYNNYVPVTGNRKEWLIKTIQSLYKNIVKRAIKRYRQQGITDSPGNNKGSVDWRLIINTIKYSIKYMG